MTKLKTLLATAALATAATGVIAYAQDESAAVEARQAAMKTIGMNLKTVSDMAKGQTEFDAEAAQAAFTTIAETAETVPVLFETPAQDPESEASDAIWENWEDFVDKAEALQAAASDASGSVTDAGSLGTAMGNVGGACGACHKAYQL